MHLPTLHLKSKSECFPHKIKEASCGACEGAPTSSTHARRPAADMTPGVDLKQASAYGATTATSVKEPNWVWLCAKAKIPSYTKRSRD